MSPLRGSTAPQLSPDGDFYWNGLTWVSLLSADGTQRWDGKAWAPRPVAPAVAAPQPATPAPEPAPAAVATGTTGLALDQLPSWLPAESARVVLGSGAVPAAQPAVSALAADLPSPLPAEGNSTWVQQTYRPEAGVSNKPRINPLLVGGAVILVLLIAAGGAFAYQQLGAGRSSPDVAHLSAAELFSAAKSSINNAGSYHLVASSGALTQEITVAGQKDAAIDLKSPTGTVSMMWTGGYQFLKAPAVFYTDKNPVLAEKAADQWIVVPSNESLLPLTSIVNLPRTADCLVGRHGTLKKVGPTMLDGQSVVEVDDAGQVPAGAPAHFYFSSDSGQLAGIDVVGTSTPGGKDPTCAGGLGIYSTTFTAVQKYRFDNWGAALEVRMPNAIDLSAKPWCGAIIGSDLNAAVRQYLLAAETFNQKLAAVDAAGCGCQFSSWTLFSAAATAEINASEEFSRNLSAIPFQGQAKADATALATAFKSRDAIMRQGLATGNITGFHAADAQRAVYENALGTRRDNLRADLGLPPSSNAPVCEFQLP